MNSLKRQKSFYRIFNNHINFKIMTATTDLQKGLNEVVMNKVHRMIDGKAAGVKATMERLIN